MNLQLKISSIQLKHKGKVNLIQGYLKRCSGKKNTYEMIVFNNVIEIMPSFKTQEAYDRVEAAIWEILNNMCEELDSEGNGCSEHYNCCDCGDSNCGCRYCFSCNACEHCLTY